MVAMLTLYRLSGDQRYKDLFDGTLDFIQRHQIAPQGGWWNTIAEAGGPDQYPSRTSMWQGAYHNARALLVCESLLRE